MTTRTVSLSATTLPGLVERYQRSRIAALRDPVRWKVRLDAHFGMLAGGADPSIP